VLFGIPRRSASIVGVVPMTVVNALAQTQIDSGLTHRALKE
jgi:ABC-type maltose transport system permease subunit